MDLEVQDHKYKITFSGKGLVWPKVYQTNMIIDRVKKIPSKRVPDFIRGDEMKKLHVLSSVDKTNPQNQGLVLPYDMSCKYIRNALFTCW